MPLCVRSVARPLWRILIVLTALAVLAGCSPPDRAAGKIKLVVWGLEAGEETAGQDARIREFERRHPNVVVSTLSMGAGNMNPQKLMTAIVGGVPPDVIRQDRFTIGDWASRDTFRSLDDLIARDVNTPLGVHAADFYPACWNEANYTNPITGKKGVFAIPESTDDRALFYNKKLFKEAGIVDEHGDAKPPRTWDELLDDSRKLTTVNADGTFNRIGFIPNFGNSWLYIYVWQNDGEFMSPDGRTCTMNAPANVEALEYMTKVYDALGGRAKVEAYQAGFQSNELDPFLTDRVAMKIDGSWVVQSIARYGPDIDFGLAPAPVPAARLRHEGRFANDKDDYITWAGGFSYAIPANSKHPAEAWEFIKWMTSPEAGLIDAAAAKAYNESKQRPYVPPLWANRKTNQLVYAQFAPASKKFREPMEQFISMMDHARFRPVTFVGQRLWDEHVRAFDNATYHASTHMTAQQAMDEGTAVVQRELDKVFRRTQFKPLPSLAINGLITVATAALLGIVIWRGVGLVRMRRLSRQEATAGYIFASPWLIGFLIFTLGPIIVSMVLSFCDYDVLHPARWVGADNFVQLLGKDSYYLQKSLTNTFYIAVIGIPLGICTSLAIAMLLNAKVSGMSLYRTFFYMPSIVPIVASSVLWLWILNGDPNRGLLNAGWKATLGVWFHMPPPGWLGDAAWSKPAIILQGLWGAGSGMILWLAGLQGVPTHLYEAADLDGAGWWGKFRNVTLPMLSPYIFFNLIMGTIGVLQTFDNVYVLSGGDLSKPVGPVDSLLVPVLYLFQNAFQYFKMGYASALAWILFVIIMILTGIQLKFASRWVYYEAEK
jgi:ABC-type sugar transport system permease subunit/ABC-type glycerol-3-phosphate transport system substrate-binding protein